MLTMIRGQSTSPFSAERTRVSVLVPYPIRYVEINDVITPQMLEAHIDDELNTHCFPPSDPVVCHSCPYPHPSDPFDLAD